MPFPSYLMLQQYFIPWSWAVTDRTALAFQPQSQSISLVWGRGNSFQSWKPISDHCIFNDTPVSITAIDGRADGINVNVFLARKICWWNYPSRFWPALQLHRLNRCWNIWKRASVSVAHSHQGGSCRKFKRGTDYYLLPRRPSLSSSPTISKLSVHSALIPILWFCNTRFRLYLSEIFSRLPQCHSKYTRLNTKKFILILAFLPASSWLN